MTDTTQGLASAVNRALILENKLRQLEQDKKILFDVVNEAEKFCKTANDLGHHLMGLKNAIERSRALVK